MDLKLRILQGKNAGQEIAITGQRFLIGRAEDCHLRPGSETISRHHCAIVVEQSYVAIRDFGSKNGTYVNGERVVGECGLKSGDQLRVGPLEFEISLEQGELGGKKRPPVHNPKEAAQRTAAGRPDEQDISQWLADPTSEAPSIPPSQSVAAIDTQSIRLTETGQIAIGGMPNFAAPRAEPTAEPANVPKRALPSTFQMPEPETPAPAAEDKSGRLDKMKVYGKLPVQPKRPEDTRSAAADLLDKLRKRRSQS